MAEGKRAVKTASKTIGVLLVLAGAVWFLQGITLLPGSFMTGDPQWAVNGGVVMLIGAGLFYGGNRK
ncbi:MAG: hypothetical protein AB1554_09710 [Chloroflexota bacterium]